MGLVFKKKWLREALFAFIHLRLQKYYKGKTQQNKRNASSIKKKVLEKGNACK